MWLGGSLRSLTANFNARDVDAVIAVMNPTRWPNAREGGRVRGHAAVRDYWKRQWAEIDPHVEPIAIRQLADGRAPVEVHRVVHNRGGDDVKNSRVVHVYEIGDGLVTSNDRRVGDDGAAWLMRRSLER